MRVVYLFSIPGRLLWSTAPGQELFRGCGQYNVPCINMANEVKGGSFMDQYTLYP